MSMLFAVLSALKSEINWIISSLAVADTAAEGSAPGDAPAADAAAHDANAGNAPDAKGTEMTSIVDTHADDAPAHHHAADSSAQEDYLHRVAYDANADAAATLVDSGGVLLAAASVGELGNVLDPAPAVSPILIEPSVTGIGGHAGSAHDADLFGDLSFNPTPFTVADDGEGTSVIEFAHSNGGSHPGGGGGALPPPAPFHTTGPLDITLNFDASVGKAPEGFVSNIENVAQFLANNSGVTTHITIAVGYGEVDGYRVPASALGESITNLDTVTYAQLYSKSYDGTQYLLPSTDPTPGANGNYWISTAEEKALGITTANSNVDGWVGFSSFRGIFDYTTTNPGDTVGAGQYDFYSVAAHEITEVMGRMLFVGTNFGGLPNSYDPLDLFHYSANGVPDFSGSVTGYFSNHGGAETSPHYFNTSPSGDFGDWASGQETDSFDAFGGSGQVALIHDYDLAVMNALGWDGILG